MDILQFWGKAQPIDSSGPQFHPLVLHSLDVAAVGKVLLSRNTGLKKAFAGLLGISDCQVVTLLSFLLSLHDIGKFAKKFQAKSPQHYPECFQDKPARSSYDHGAGGLRLFDVSPSLFCLPEGRHWWPLVSAIAGHHGSPPEPDLNRSKNLLRQDFGQVGIRAASEFARRMRGILGVPNTVGTTDRNRLRRASHAVAGLTVLADWIGSNQRWFRYARPDPDLEAYWRSAQDKANAAVTDAGLLPETVGARIGYDRLIGESAVPTPMQTWASEVGLPKGPALFLIEDETGSGKTEAALMLAHRLMASGAAEGVYIALPTMATANAMFDRLGVAVRHLFGASSCPSVALTHSAGKLHESFRDALPLAEHREKPYAATEGLQDASGETASTACSEWIASDRRRAFLAHAGAGTIDQALLSVLPSRHQSLRLLGLMRRVLILDEVHAFDAYMQQEMAALLEFHAGLGGSAILLSATLPLHIRERLTRAFAKGLGPDIRPVPHSSDYPLATVCARSVGMSAKVKSQQGRARRLPVRFLRSPEEGVREVEQAAADGKAVLYVRNTVDDALGTYTELRERGLGALLFHSRFALTDRLGVEREITRRFGKWSKASDRRGQILVATQVVEQSLDLDFDAMVTDLAPIDLLVQRAGRLWRHRREVRKGTCELLVVSPRPVPDADENWFKKSFPRASYVYKDHARLWLTAKVLEDARVIDSPGKLRTMIEFVYGDGAEENVPEALLDVFMNAEGRSGAERSVAKTNTLNLGKGYVRDGGAWGADWQTPTRLDDYPQVTLRLGRYVHGRIEPYAAGEEADEAWRAWRLSEIQAPEQRIAAEAASRELADSIRMAKASWTRFDADKILVVLHAAEGGKGFVGSAARDKERTEEVRVRYSRSEGLRIDTKPLLSGLVIE